MDISKLSSHDKWILVTVYYYGIQMLNDQQARRYIEMENTYGLSLVNEWKKELSLLV